MHKFTIALVFFVCAGAVFSQNSPKKERPPETFAVQFSQDNAFGFLPSATGSFPVSPDWSFTFYGNFWTNPFYGTASTGSIDLWMETGIGMATVRKQGRWLLNPSVGLTNGKLLSGGQDGVFGDGIVPNLFSFYKDRRWECEFYAGYYKSLRGRSHSSDFLLGWLMPGFFVKKNVSLGLHLEQFRLSRVSGGDAQNLYQMVGGYVKFTVAERYWLRFSGGQNFVKKSDGGYSKDFYRMTVGMLLQ